MTTPAKKPARKKPSPRRSGREGLRGSMSNDPKVARGERDRDTIPHAGREGFGDGQELSHSKVRR